MVENHIASVSQDIHRMQGSGDAHSGFVLMLAASLLRAVIVVAVLGGVSLSLAMAIGGSANGVASSHGLLRTSVEQVFSGGSAF